MTNSFSGVSDRLSAVRQDVSTYSKCGSGKEEQGSYDSSDIGEESPAKHVLSGKKQEEDGGGLGGILAKIFAKAGLEMPEPLKELVLLEKNSEKGRDDEDYSYADKKHASYSSEKPAAHAKCEARPAEQVKAEAPPAAPPASEKTGKPVEGEQRPASDTRSADQIINDNPVLKNLGNQKDIQRDKLKERCGDWTADNKDPKSRADAAWKMSHVLNWIDNSKTANGKDIKDAGNGDITGITKGGDARHGTKAGLLKDFGDKGYPAIKGDQCLDHTKDSHVREDGTNKDNFQWAVGQVGKGLKYILPGLGKVMEGIGESKGGIGGMIKGGFEGVVKTWKADFEGLKNALLHGKLSPTQLLTSMYKANVTDSLKDDGKKKAGEVLDKLPI